MNREVTQQQLANFKAALEQWSNTPPEGVHPRLHQACREAIEVQIRDLEQQLEEGDRLQGES